MMSTDNIQIQKKFSKYLRNFFTSISPTFYSIASVLAFAAINYTIIHSPIVMIATAVLFVHELAHYYYAKSAGAQVSFPIILPIPFFAIAFVKVKNLLNKYKSEVAISGLLFGSLTISFIAAFNYIFSFIPFYFLALLFSFEFLFNFIGSDGSKYRRYRKSF